MKYAIAFVYENIPRHNRVELSPNKTEYYLDKQKVYEEYPTDSVVIRQPTLDLMIVEASNSEEAFKKAAETFPYHILNALIQSVG